MTLAAGSQTPADQTSNTGGSPEEGWASGVLDPGAQQCH